jgi:hypothetical protein
MQDGETVWGWSERGGEGMAGGFGCPCRGERISNIQQGISNFQRLRWVRCLAKPRESARPRLVLKPQKPPKPLILQRSRPLFSTVCLASYFTRVSPFRWLSPGYSLAFEVNRFQHLQISKPQSNLMKIRPSTIPASSPHSL